MSFWCKRGAIFEKFTFFGPRTYSDIFFDDLGGFGGHLRSQNGTNMALKIDQKIVDFWIAPGRALDRQGRPGHV